MKMALGARLTTGMTLTPQMQQAIRLLQLSSLELEQEVQQKLDSNPLLEREEAWQDSETFEDSALSEAATLTLEDYNSADFTAQASTNNESDWAETASPFDWQAGLGERSGDYRISSLNTDSDWGDEGNTQTDYADYGQDAIDSADYFASDQFDITVDTQWDEVYTHEPTGLSRLDTDDLDDDYKFGTQGNIQDHIRWQLNFKHLSDIDMMIAEYLIDSMDERGFITLATDELFHSLDTMLSFYQVDDIELEPADIEVVVKHIQSCEPLGVGARNLAECLLLQLNRLSADTPFCDKAKLLLAYPDYFANNNINALLKATGLTLEDIQPSLALLRTLDPNPALSYQQTQRHFDFAPASYDIPDVLVTPSQAGWQVKLNPDTLPKLRVNQEYANLITRNDTSEQGTYLREQLYDARLFIRSIEERNQNLLKVATCIVKRQQAFFELGVTAMQPMILKDVADEVGLHESTVSRITTSKTMLTPAGLFSMKYFFSSQVSNEDGEGVSSTAISAMIKQMIDEENPKKPLSDSAIMDKLKADGIDIARRTVTKYREAMNIGSSTQRKQRF